MPDRVPNQNDVVVVGGGLSGTIAAVVLARAGIGVTLIDRHRVYPPDFRVEHLDGEQCATLGRLGLLAEIVAGVPRVDHVASAQYGRLLGVWPTCNYGIRYDSLVGTARALLPSSVNFLVGRVVDMTTSPTEQQVVLADGRRISGRLLVLASGLGHAICRRVGIEHRMLHEAHSLTFGFDIEPLGREAFDFPFYVYWGEKVQDRIDYLSAFMIGDRLRVNLFTYRDYREPWARRMQQQSEETLLQTLPGLAAIWGQFHIVGPVQARPMDLYVSERVRRPGVVLIGDAFQTSCPPAGIGVTRLLIDVERLCTVYVPQWLKTAGMAAEKISAFYDDPIKQASDARARHTAEYRRAVTTETSLRWGLHRRRLAVQRRARAFIGYVPTRLGKLAMRVGVCFQGSLDA